MKRTLGVFALGLLLSACSSVEPTSQREEQSVLKKDGELALPDDYRSWPVFMRDIQRADTKQIRDIYINPPGTRVKSGNAFPNGTRFVMEIHTVKLNPDGTPVRGGDGKMVKDTLAKIFVMGKGAGWGELAPPNLKTGDWIYSAFDGKGTRNPDDASSCRACHLPLASKDFVFHYDDYFQRLATRSNTATPARLPSP